MSEQSNSSGPPWLTHAWGQTSAVIVAFAFMVFTLAGIERGVGLVDGILIVISGVAAAIVWPMLVGVAIGVLLALALL